MGIIKNIILNKKVPTPQLNKRLTVELCENIHLHYRNLRLEFEKNEFLHILKLLKTLNEKDIENFDYKDGNFKELIHDGNLPDKTEFNDRLQIEEQAQGHYHLHYRNFRIEIDNLDEIGIKK